MLFSEWAACEQATIPCIPAGIALGIAAFTALVVLWRRSVRACRAWWRRTPFGDKRPPIPYHVRRAVLDRDGWRCRECGSTRDLQLDHVHPWSRGGAHDDPANLQCLCRLCNRGKGARVPSLWARLRWSIYLRRTS